MAEKNSLVEQMLEHLVNGEQQKAEELFHDYVVAKSRDIYEGLIESEIAEGDDEDEDDEEKEDKEVEEGFGDEFAEADATDDLEAELDMGDEGDMGDMGDEGDMDGEESEEEIMQDLGDIIDELQAKFDALSSSEEEQGEFDDEGDMGDMGDDEEVKDDFELETVREYVEKVPAGHGAEKKGAAEKADGSAGGLKFSKNDMGGTSANILSGRNGAEAGLANQGELKGSGLLKGKPQDMKTGNLNTVGGFKGDAFKKNGSGHGAEKKGSAEGSTDGASLFRGRR